MTLCVTVASDGAVTVLTDPADTCPGYVLLSGSEYASVTAVAPFFGVPTATEAALAWQIGFVTPVVIALFTWAVAAIVSTINDE